MIPDEQDAIRSSRHARCRFGTGASYRRNETFTRGIMALQELTVDHGQDLTVGCHASRNAYPACSRGFMASPPKSPWGR
jgi:hypothetical protein